MCLKMSFLTKKVDYGSLTLDNGGVFMKNLWEELYSKKQEEAMMKFPFPIVIELVNFYSKKYPNIQPKNINVLEVGCGSGSNIKYLAELGYNVYGIDISETAVNYAKTSFLQHNLKGNIQTASVDSLPFENDFFHIVIDQGVLMCVNEEVYKQAINEIYRVMHRGGVALLTPKSEISSTSIRLKQDDNENNYLFKDSAIYINSITLNAVVKILNNRFNIVYLRRNDRTNYTISEDYKFITAESVDSIYHIFIEKI